MATETPAARRRKNIRPSKERKAGPKKNAQPKSGTDFLLNLDKLQSEHKDKFRSPHKNWRQLVKEGQLAEMVLTPGSFISDKEIRNRKLQNTYYPDPDAITTTIDRDTLFWSPGKKEIEGIYLKQRIPKELQDLAFEGLEEMEWTPPRTRRETIPAIERQERIGGVPAGELLFGHTARGSIEKTLDSRSMWKQFMKLGKLLGEMNSIFSRTIPTYYSKQNHILSLEKRVKERQERTGRKPGTEFGGTPDELRIPLSVFTTITLLRNCPAAIHKDNNARKDQSSFSCLTTVGENFTGGTFCLLEPGLRIPVKPGDVLIAQTTKMWHCNLTPVQGKKYSVVAYSFKEIANPVLTEKWRKKQ